MRLCALILAMCLPMSTYAAELNVLSWNIYMLPWPIKNSLQRERSLQLSPMLGATNYDLMFFQEAFSKGFRKEMKKKAGAKYPYNTYLKSDGKIKHVFGSGLFIMSRRPFKILDHTYFKTCAGADCFAAKGSILIETTLANGRTVQLATTHLQAIQAQGSCRMEQVTLIQKMLKRNQRHGIPQILVGDLNISPNQPESEKGLALLNFQDAPLEGPIKYTSGLKNSCYKTGSGRKWIDHAWASTDGTVRDIGVRVKPMTFKHDGDVCPGSDHHAIEVHAELN